MILKVKYESLGLFINIKKILEQIQPGNYLPAMKTAN